MFTFHCCGIFLLADLTMQMLVYQDEQNIAIAKLKSYLTL